MLQGVNERSSRTCSACWLSSRHMGDQLLMRDMQTTHEGADPFAPAPVVGPAGPPPPSTQPPWQELNTLATLSVVFAFAFAPQGSSATWGWHRSPAPASVAAIAHWSGYVVVYELRAGQKW